MLDTTASQSLSVKLLNNQQDMTSHSGPIQELLNDSWFIIFKIVMQTRRHEINSLSKQKRMLLVPVVSRPPN